MRSTIQQNLFAKVSCPLAINDSCVDKSCESEQQLKQFSVLDAFDIKDRAGRKLLFLSQAGSVIPATQLSKVVEQFKGCGCFLLRMVFNDEKEDSSDLSAVSVLQLIS